MPRTTRKKRPPAPPSPREIANCADKQRFPSFGAAEWRARELLFTQALLRYVYKCRVCGSFHLTSNARNRRW